MFRKIVPFVVLLLTSASVFADYHENRDKLMAYAVKQAKSPLILFRVNTFFRGPDSLYAAVRIAPGKFRVVGELTGLPGPDLSHEKTTDFGKQADRIKTFVPEMNKTAADYKDPVEEEDGRPKFSETEKPETAIGAVLTWNAAAEGLQIVGDKYLRTIDPLFPSSEVRRLELIKAAPGNHYKRRALERSYKQALDQAAKLKMELDALDEMLKKDEKELEALDKEP